MTTIATKQRSSLRHGSGPLSFAIVMHFLAAHAAHERHKYTLNTTSWQNPK